VSPDTPIGGIVWVVGDVVEVYRKHVDDLTRPDTGLVEHRTEAFRWSGARHRSADLTLFRPAQGHSPEVG
jgi:hypothetical protein